MAESETLVSSSGEVRLVKMQLPRLNDENIQTEVEQTHSRYGYSVLRREPLLISISQILEPATHFVDSILLEKKETEGRIRLQASNLLEFNSALSKLKEYKKYPFYDDYTIKGLIRTAKDETEEMFDEINVHETSISRLKSLSNKTWEEKAAIAMANLVLKFVELLELLLHGPNRSSIDLASSMAALMEPVSLVGTPIEKFQQALDQLNSLIKITLELIKYICELTLLQDTEYSREDLATTSVYWVILSTVAGCIQMTLIIDNKAVALELSNLLLNLSQILNDLKHNYTICKQKIEEMDAHIQSHTLFEDIFDIKDIFDPLELMKRLVYSKSGHQSLIDGSTMSEVEIEVLKEKVVLLVISHLDISPQNIKRLLKIYERTVEENYYKIVWIPFVLKWTQELRHKFENLKSKMPWYIVCSDSPIECLWYFKGRWNNQQTPVALVTGCSRQFSQPISIADLRIFPEQPTSGGRTMIIPTYYFYPQITIPTEILTVETFSYSPPQFHYALQPSLTNLYTNELAKGREERRENVGVPLSNPSSGFQGLLSKYN